jgi:hypothetical protein
MKEFYTRMWFWIIIAIVVISVTSMVLVNNQKSVSDEDFLKLCKSYNLMTDLANSQAKYVNLLNPAADLETNWQLIDCENYLEVIKK